MDNDGSVLNLHPFGSIVFQRETEAESNLMSPNRRKIIEVASFQNLISKIVVNNSLCMEDNVHQILIIIRRHKSARISKFL